MIIIRSQIMSSRTSVPFSRFTYRNTRRWTAQWFPMTAKLIRKARYPSRSPHSVSRSCWLVVLLVAAGSGQREAQREQCDRDRDHGVGEEDDPLGGFGLDLGLVARGPGGWRAGRPLLVRRVRRTDHGQLLPVHDRSAPARAEFARP